MQNHPLDTLFEEFYMVKNSLEISIDRMKQLLSTYSDKIVLYGAGSAGIAFLYYLRDIGIEPKYFADGNSEKWGHVCEGLKIIDYREIVKILGKDALVIVTINTDGKKYCKSFDETLRVGGHSQVYRNLYAIGCEKVIDYTYFRRCHNLFVGDRYNLPSCSDVYLMEKHKEDLKQVYSWLSDDISRNVFLGIVKYRMIDDSISIPTEPQDRQYFEYDVFKKRKDEVFIDCGAYNGISLKAFLAENNNIFTRYYGLEPDCENYKQLKKYIGGLDDDLKSKILISEKAAYDCNSKAKLYALGGPGSFLSNIGNCVVDTITIDSLIKDDCATYIKMNIEGAELNALQGAEKTIKNNTPRMAIAAYHKTWDLWEIPKLIMSYTNTYKIALKSYMNHVSFIYYFF